VNEIDVVIVSFNSRASLRHCVEELALTERVHVTVVDNASADGSLQVVSDLEVTTIANAENVGFARGCNEGWRAGDAPFVLFLNPDATIDPDAVLALAAALERHPEAGAVAPRIERPDGSLDFSLRRFPRLRSRYAQALFLHRLFPRATWVDEVVRDPHAYDREGVVEWASGACLLVRRRALESIGGFDERYFMYCEDVDLCRSLSEAGCPVRFEPSVTCVHEGGASAPRASLLPVLTESRALYAEKHFTRIGVVAERLGLALCASIHMIASPWPSVRAGHARSLRIAFGLGLTRAGLAASHSAGPGRSDAGQTAIEGNRRAG